MNFKEFFEKEAAPDGFWGGVKSVGTSALGGALATAGAAGVGVAAHKIYDAVTKARDFRQMLGSPFNADLHDHYTSRPAQFNHAFSSLRSVAPDMSKDPMVAGLYMRRMMAYGPDQAGGVLVEALTHTDKTPSPMLEAFTRGGASGAQEAIRGHVGQQSQESGHEFSKKLEAFKDQLSGSRAHEQREGQHENAMKMEMFKKMLEPVGGRKRPSGDGQE